MLKVIVRFLKWFLALVTTARDWTYRRGTNLAQIINIAYAGSFIYVFGFADEVVDIAPIYRAFVPFDQSRWWLIMPAIIVFQLIFMLAKSIRCSALSGFVLICSFPVWTFVAITFDNSGFTNTGTFIYGIWAVVCLTGGWRMMDLYDYKIIIKKKGGGYAKRVSNRATSTDNTANGICNDRRINRSVCTDPAES